MVTTMTKSGHKKFDNNSFNTADEVEPKSPSSREDSDESESDSDDEAPEEESMSSTIDSIKEREAQEKLAIHDEKSRLKLKRKKQQEQFAKQQELKRLKEEKLAEQNLLELKRQEEVAKEIELKRLRKQKEEEELMRQFERQRALDLKKEKLKNFHKEQNGVRTVEGGIKVKVLMKKTAGGVMKGNINKESILNKRKKKLNRKI